LMPDHIDTVVTEPKRRMIARAYHVRLNAEVIAYDRDTKQISRTKRVELGRLIEDCFAELGGYVAHCALALDLDQAADRRAPRAEAAQRRKELADRIEQARRDESSRMGVIVTHPSGIDRTREAIYRRAGQRFLDGLCGARERGAGVGEVRLVAEALAA